MKAKWIPLTEDCELNEPAFITIWRKNQNGQKFLDVDIAHVGWGFKNGGRAYMPLPRDITKQPEAWKSEYRDDDFPSKNTACLVQLQGTQIHNESRLKIISSYYLSKEKKFLRIPDGWEVIGWMEYPKPYKN